MPGPASHLFIANKIAESYDDISEAEIAAPALTSVWNGQQEVGKRAARAMISILAGNDPARERVLIEPELRIRDTAEQTVSFAS